MPDTKISIVLPVYNVEKWLHRAAKSLQKQTFSDFEAWFVDDGSKDKSGSICDEISQKDSRFKTIHQNNKGAAAARNAAIPKCKGKYIYFMDPDDWCEPTMLEDMYNIAIKNNLQLVVTGFYIDTYYSNDKFFRETKEAPNKIYASQQEFREDSYILYDNHLLYTPWNKLYDRKFIMDNNLRFPTNEFWDDLLFNLDVLKKVERVGCSSKKYYHFLRARRESEGAKYRNNLYEKREDENTRINKLYEDWKVMNNDIREFIDRRYSERLIGCIENLTSKSCNLPKKEVKKQISRMINTHHAQKAIHNTKPKTLMMRLMLFPLKHKMTNLCYIECKFISYVKRHCVKTFAILKANR